jgi:integrase
MSTRSTGQVLERSGSHGKVYALRFQAYERRRYLTLGSEAEGWTRIRAEEELKNVLADVRRVIWVPPGAMERWKPVAEVERANCFGPFARALLIARRGQVTPATIRYMEWSLSHLMPYFADWPLGEIDVRAVDAYRAHKVKESEARHRALERERPKRDEEGRVLRALSASSINKTIDNLQWVLSIALEQGRIERNPAVGRRRRLKEPRLSTRHLDSPPPDRSAAEAASQLDRDPRWPIGDRHPIIATFLFAGLRAHELGSLRWRDVDLDSARISVTRSKTPAGLREISLFPVLADVLRCHRSSSTPTTPGRWSSRRDREASAARTTSASGSCYRRWPRPISCSRGGNSRRCQPG